MKVIVPYIGKDLSVNYYRIRGRGGLETTKIKPHVKIWMQQLGEKVRGFETDGNLTISLYGKFVDNRVPDLHNLHKVIGDAIKEGVGYDDKDFKFIDLGYEIGHDKPVLEIELT